jgi:hypothetical protein
MSTKEEMAEIDQMEAGSNQPSVGISYGCSQCVVFVDSGADAAAVVLTPCMQLL